MIRSQTEIENVRLTLTPRSMMERQPSCNTHILSHVAVLDKFKVASTSEPRPITPEDASYWICTDCSLYLEWAKCFTCFKNINRQDQVNFYVLVVINMYYIYLQNSRIHFSVISAFNFWFFYGRTTDHKV